jgi:CheY-like chemotaxis protein
VVADAQEALRLTGSMPVDLLVIDYHLADMNGIEVYDSLQRKEELREVPALLLSASIEQHAEELQQRQLVGLPKTFELDELLQAVEQLLMYGVQIGYQ